MTKSFNFFVERILYLLLWGELHLVMYEVLLSEVLYSSIFKKLKWKYVASFENGSAESSMIWFSQHTIPGTVLGIRDTKVTKNVEMSL